MLPASNANTLNFFGTASRQNRQALPPAMKIGYTNLDINTDTESSNPNIM